ncbi:MAG TPA: zinc-ribbon domain-containing protein [Solirubrobacteraceae bacterium]|nr:zinc-ribbon domain-containing protein [Solirubrobacteraceae bacterium]
MIFLLFGFATKVRLRGESAERTCPRCANTTRWRHFERYRYLSLFFVRVARWHREQLDACPVCGHIEPHAETHRHRPPFRRPAHAA